MCSEDFIKMLNMYKEHEIEVGGMIFGRKILKKYNINSLTFKKGEAFKIDFSFDDKKIYQAPINQKLIGTWHLHPMQNDAAPSYTDVSVKLK